MKFCLYYCLAIVSISQSLKAHDPGFSLAVLAIGANSIGEVVQCSREEVNSLIFRPGRAVVNPLVTPVLLFENSEPANSEPPGISNSDILLHRYFPKPYTDQILIRSSIDSELNPGHRLYSPIRDGEQNLFHERFLRADEDTVVLEQPRPVETLRPESGNAALKVQMLFLFCSLVGFLTFAMCLFWLTRRFGLFSRKWRTMNSVFSAVFIATTF